MNAHPDLNQAERYRERAVELGIIASTMRDKLSRKILEGVAEDYERMARSWDAIAASEAVAKKLARGK